MQTVGQVLHVPEGVSVRSCDGVEAEVVPAGPPRAILLGPMRKGDAQAEFGHL